MDTYGVDCTGWTAVLTEIHVGRPWEENSNNKHHHKLTKIMAVEPKTVQ